jgi:hypothetical protein
MKKVVTPYNLSPEHFRLNQTSKKIEVIFPTGASGISGLALDGQKLTYMEGGVAKELNLKNIIQLDGKIEGTKLKLSHPEGGGAILEVDMKSLKGLGIELQDAFGQSIVEEND